MIEPLENDEHNNSNGGFMDMFDIFTNPPKNDVIQETKPLIVYPTSIIRPESRILSFRLEPQNAFIKLSETRLNITLKLHNRDGTDIAAPSEPAGAEAPGNNGATFENFIGGTLIKSAELYLNDELISPGGDNYPITSFLILVLNYDKHTLDKKWEIAGYNYEADPSNLNYVMPGGFRNRLKATRGSRKFFVSTPLFLNLFLSEKALLPMTSLKLDLVLNSPGIAIKSGLAAAARANLDYSIYNPELVFKKIKTTSEYQLSFERRLLSSGGGRYYVPLFSTKSFVIGAGLKQFTQMDVFNSQFIPQYMFVCLTDFQASLGDTGSTIFDFKPFNIKSIVVRSADDPSPSTYTEMNFGERNYFHSFLRFMQDTWSEANNGIDLDAFKSHFTIHFFDMNQFQTSTPHTKRIGSCNLEVNFLNEDNPSLRLYVFSCTKGFIGCDSTRKFQRFF